MKTARASRVERGAAVTASGWDEVMGNRVTSRPQFTSYTIKENAAAGANAMAGRMVVVLKWTEELKRLVPAK